MTLYAPEQRPASQVEDHPPAQRWPAVLGYVLMLLALPLGFALGGEASSFASTGAMFAIFLILALLAYLGQEHTPARLLALAWWLMLMLGAALFTIGFTMLAAGVIHLGGGDGPPRLAAGGMGTLAATAPGIVAALLLSGLALLPPVRRLLAHILPLDPASFVHAVALSTVTGLLVVVVTPLWVIGEPPILSPAFMKIAADSGSLDAQSNLLATVYMLVWTIPVAIFAVGYGVKRTFAGSLRRLRLTRPTARQIALAVAAAVVLVVAASWLDRGIGVVWEAMGWPRTDNEAFGEMIAFAFTPLGAVVIAVSAGLWEELGVRGVLQPRLGIVLSNAFFAGLHALQYNWDGVLVVFLLGATFGLLRKRTNTTTSAIAHGLYDFLLVMMAIYGISI